MEAPGIWSVLLEIIAAFYLDLKHASALFHMG